MSLDQLTESDTRRMTDAAVRASLTREGVGVLGLADDGVPYLVPLSFGFDGESTLYFVYLLFGPESRKERLSERADRARFLTYGADSIHDWHSVVVTGGLEAVPDDEWSALRDAMENAWHPELFRSASPMRGVRGFRLRAEEWTGIEQE